MSTKQAAVHEPLLVVDHNHLLGQALSKTRLGLAFKPNTDDMREAPAFSIVTALQDAGATVRGYDPESMAQAGPLTAWHELRASAYECLEGADAMVILTEWNEFRALDLPRIKSLLKTPIFCRSAQRLPSRRCNVYRLPLC